MRAVQAPIGSRCPCDMLIKHRSAPGLWRGCEGGRRGSVLVTEEGRRVLNERCVVASSGGGRGVELRTQSNVKLYITCIYKVQ